MKPTTVFGVLLTLAAIAAHADADDSGNVKNSVVDLYRRMNAHDTAGALRYLSADGFTEISPGFPEPRHFSASDVEALLRSDVRIHLAVQDLKTSVSGETAVVSGMRVGGINPAGQAAQDRPLQFTMVWKKLGDRWTLFYVHLAPQNG
jgi:hypothetical protein